MLYLAKRNRGEYQREGILKMSINRKTIKIRHRNLNKRDGKS